MMNAILRSVCIATICASLAGAGPRPTLQAGDEQAAPAQPAAAESDNNPPARPSGAAAITKSLVEMFNEGGILMWPILGCSVVLLAFTVERLIMLRRSRVIPRGFLNRIMGQLESGSLERASAIAMCRENGSAVARVFEYVVRNWGQPRMVIEQAINEGGQREVAELKRNIRVVNAVSTISPLLGLLGTVMGLVQCFAKVASSPDSLGKPAELAEGIYVALYTTVFGLVVAIPALVVYYYLVGRVERLVGEIDALAQEVVEHVAEDHMAPTRAATLPIETAPPAPKSASRAKRPAVSPAAATPRGGSVSAES